MVENTVGDTIVLERRDLKYNYNRRRLLRAALRLTKGKEDDNNYQNEITV